MFIDRTTVNNLRLEAETCRVEARVLSEQNRILETTLDWMRMRLTQVEQERAQLLFNFTEVKVAVPSIERETPPGMSRESVSDILSAVAHFGDVGDAEAAKLGVDWHEDGTVRY